MPVVQNNNRVYLLDFFSKRICHSTTPRNPICTTPDSLVTAARSQCSHQALVPSRNSSIGGCRTACRLSICLSAPFAYCLYPTYARLPATSPPPSSLHVLLVPAHHCRTGSKLTTLYHTQRCLRSHSLAPPHCSLLPLRLTSSCCTTAHSSRLLKAREFLIFVDHSCSRLDSTSLSLHCDSTVTGMTIFPPQTHPAMMNQSVVSHPQHAGNNKQLICGCAGDDLDDLLADSPRDEEEEADSDLSDLDALLDGYSDDAASAAKPNASPVPALNLSSVAQSPVPALNLSLLSNSAANPAALSLDAEEVSAWCYGVLGAMVCLLLWCAVVLWCLLLWCACCYGALLVRAVLCYMLWCCARCCGTTEFSC